MGKARKNMGLGLVIAAFFFLFNPYLSVVDVIPDFIGYALLCIGISQLADMNYHFEEALRYFKKMLLVSLAQTFCLFILFGFVTGKERPTALLLFAFTFAAIDIIVLTHAYNAFFEGMIYMGSRMDSTAVFHISEAQQKRFQRKKEKWEARIQKENERRKKKNLPARPLRELRAPQNATSRMALFTTVFVVVKAVLTALPEFASLALSSAEDTAQNRFELYDFIGLFREVELLILVPLGIAWLVKMVKYVRSLTNDTAFMSALYEKYVTEVEPKSYLFIQRAIKLAFAVFSIGALFSIDFYIENNSILPDFLCPIIFIVALLLLKKFIKIPFYTYLLCGAHAVTSAITYILSANFYSNYTLSLTNIRIEAYNAFQIVSIVKIVDSVLFFAMMLSLLPVLHTVIKSYTGFAPVSEANVHSEEKLRYVHSMLGKKLIVLLVIAALGTVSSICYILLVRDVTFMWMIDFVLYAAFAVHTFTSLNAIAEEVEYKYLLN